jgi:hypothetical protein
VAEAAGRDFAAAPDTCFAAVRQAQLDVLGDLVAAHLDRAALSQLIREGRPRDCRSSTRPVRWCSGAATRHPAWKDLGRKIVGHLGTP